MYQNVRAVLDTESADRHSFGGLGIDPSPEATERRRERLIEKMVAERRAEVPIYRQPKIGETVALRGSGFRPRLYRIVGFATSPASYYRAWDRVTIRGSDGHRHTLCLGHLLTPNHSQIVHLVRPMLADLGVPQSRRRKSVVQDGYRTGHRLIDTLDYDGRPVQVKALNVTVHSRYRDVLDPLARRIEAAGLSGGPVQIEGRTLIVRPLDSLERQVWEDRARSGGRPMPKTKRVDPRIEGRHRHPEHHDEIVLGRYAHLYGSQRSRSVCDHCGTGYRWFD